MDIRTHLEISPDLVGEVVAAGSGTATVRLLLSQEMAADERGLAHGGFTFGLADYAAMLAVNDPHVVLGAAQVRFTAPVRVGESVTAQAEVIERRDQKNVVHVTCSVAEGRVVLEGDFTCFVLDRHILDR